MLSGGELGRAFPRSTADRRQVREESPGWRRRGHPAGGALDGWPKSEAGKHAAGREKFS